MQELHVCTYTTLQTGPLGLGLRGRGLIAEAFQFIENKVYPLFRNKKDMDETSTPFPVYTFSLFVRCWL